MNSPLILFARSSLALVVLLAACCYCSLAAPNKLSLNLAGDDWTQFHYKVFATQGEPVPPQETFEYLKRLKQLYEPVPEGDKLTQTRCDKVNKLLRASDMEQANCQDPTQFRQLKDLIEYNEPFKVNVVPYLQFARKRLFAFCGDSFYGQLQEALGMMSQDDEINMIGADFFDEFKSGFELKAGTEQEEKQLLGGFLNLLQKRTKILKDSTAKRAGVAGRKAFERYYDKFLDGICEPYYMKLAPAFEKYHLFDIGLDMFESNFPHKWLIYSSFCHQLTTEEKSRMVRRSHEIFFDRHCARGIGG